MSTNTPLVRRMTPKQHEALRMLNDAFESHDGAQVREAVITLADYRLLYEALAEGTAGDLIAQDILGHSSEIATPPGYRTGKRRLVYNKLTKQIDVVTQEGFVVDSFDPPLEAM